jgi:osmotically-inducible protein OsmY
MAQTTLRTPEQLRGRILEQLLWDSRLDASGIRVEMDGDTVRLTGTVATFADSRAAEDDARAIAGVGAVVNALVVRYPEGVTLPSDADIESNIRSIFFWSSSIPSSRVRPSVIDGVVTLEGSVDTYWQKLKAEELAADVIGVIGVDNRLAVVPTESYHDEAIAGSIIAALDRNINIDTRSINVEVENGTVTLSGTVSDWTSLREAEKTALYMSGVKAVTNNLTVRPTPQ